MNLFKQLRSLISKNDSRSFEEIEEFLLSNNFGVEFTEAFVNFAREKKITEENLKEFFYSRIKEIFGSVDPNLKFSENSPNIFLFLGSNGSGKTTTIAKLGGILKNEGKSVLFIAGDTFRAQASEQLEEWAKKLNIPIVKSSMGTDPASVVYDGMTSAKSKNIDVVLIDTSGRVETKANLVEEIKKIERVIEKSNGRKPDETLLVIDSYAGLNAISQVEVFSSALQLTGIILSKFDGSAPSGVIIPIVDKFKIPVKLIGMGENISDLEYFSIDKYLSKLGY